MINKMLFAAFLIMSGMSAYFAASRIMAGPVLSMEKRSSVQKHRTTPQVVPNANFQFGFQIGIQNLISTSNCPIRPASLCDKAENDETISL